MNILIAMAGSGHRFAREGYKDPKPLIDVLGKPMVERVIENLKPRCRKHKFIFVVHAKHLTEEFIEILNKYDGTIIATPFYTDGAARTALLAKSFISNNEPLLLAACDQLIDVNIEQFIDYEWTLDGKIMTFPDNDPSHSYCVVQDDLVTEVQEKSPIPPSDHSNIGIYFFKQGKDFVEGAEQMILKDITTNGEYYVAPVYNELIEANKKIKIYEIPKEKTHLIGTPKDLERYINDHSKTTAKVSR